MINLQLLRLPAGWVILCWLAVSAAVSASAQPALTLDSCLSRAQQRYPLIRQQALIEKSGAFNLANAQKGYLPRVQIAGQATYQSDVTEIPIELPGFDFPEMSKDQYRLYGEIRQPITGLFTVNERERNIRNRTAIAAQQTKVALYALNDRVNDLYFGILLLEAQLRETELLKQEIQTGIEKTNVAVAHGVAIPSDADMLRAELLKADRRTIELSATRKGYLDMLALLTGLPLTVNTRLEVPPAPEQPKMLQRPELKLYELQKHSFQVQRSLLDVSLLPQLNLFFRGGWGRPGLNMLDNDFQAYYIGGLQLSWQLSGLYTARNDRKLLDIREQTVEVQRETFLLNTRLQLKQESAEMEKIRQLIATDQQIVTLREQVTATTRHQLQYGTATTHDYVRAVNAENRARQEKSAHKIQLLMAGYRLQTTAGRSINTQDDHY